MLSDHNFIFGAHTKSAFPSEKGAKPPYLLNIASLHNDIAFVRAVSHVLLMLACRLCFSEAIPIISGIEKSYANNMLSTTKVRTCTRQYYYVLGLYWVINYEEALWRHVGGAGGRESVCIRGGYVE